MRPPCYNYLEFPGCRTLDCLWWILAFVNCNSEKKKKYFICYIIFYMLKVGVFRSLDIVFYGDICLYPLTVLRCNSIQCFQRKTLLHLTAPHRDLPYRPQTRTFCCHPGHSGKNSTTGKYKPLILQFDIDLQN